MITVDNYKAFHGLMRIESKSKRVPVIEIEGDWLYKPHTNTWHCNGISYPAKICTVVKDDAEKLSPKKPINKHMEYDGQYGHCPCCNRIISDNYEFRSCPNCGQALDWSE